jgi:hypothetical protein
VSLWRAIGWTLAAWAVAFGITAALVKALGSGAVR